MIPDPPGGVGRDREPAGRATTTAPTGSAGEADGGRPRARRGGGGDRDPVEKSRAARVLGNAAGRGGREGERRRPRGRSSPSRDVRGGGAPRTHDAREGRTSGTGRVIDRSPRRRQPEESGHATRWGISPPGAQPGADGGSPHVRRERPSRRTDDGAGRVPRRTSADGPTVNSRRPRTTPAKPLSLARFPETRGGLLFFPHSHRPPPSRQTRPPPPQDLRRRRAPTRPATRRRRPTAVSPKAAPEREVTGPRRQNRIPGPEEGRVTAAPRSWERCRGEGERGDSTRHAATSDTHARDAHGEAADAGTAKTGKRGRDRSRRARTVRTGGTREPTATQPRSSRSAPRPEACAPSPSGERGDRGVPRRSGARTTRAPSSPDHG